MGKKRNVYIFLVGKPKKEKKKKKETTRKTKM
jgi:hypothetical protein